MAKSTNDYFAMFADLVDISNQAAKYLHKALDDFHPEKLEQQMAELHHIESDGDEGMHRLRSKLAKEFITPIEREDILALAYEIDDVTDSIEDVLLKIYMYNIQSILPEAMEFITVVEQCCNALHVLMKEFPNFRKSKLITEMIIELNRLEEDGDRLYQRALRNLYVGRGDPYDTAGWTEVFNCFEKCCDTCEHVAGVVESVIMKNS